MNKFINLTAIALIISATPGCLPVAAVGTAVVGTSIAEERVAGDKLNDNIIAVKIRDAYVQHEFSELLTRISVTVHEGRVLLVGNLKGEAYVNQAIDIAWEVEGVREVISELIVAPTHVREYAKDTFIANAVRSKLLLEQDVRSVNYKVDSNNGTVYLLGVAQDQKELTLAINIARNVSGVKQVVSHVLLRDDSRRKKNY
jgi:osmotically-inducible protein OsmY